MKLRNEMLIGSFEAGKAFTRSYVGYVHSIAHAIGGIYGTPHGLANSVILPVILDNYGSAIYKPLSDLAMAVGLAGNTDDELAKAFIAEIRHMNREMNIPEKLSEIKEEDIPELAYRAAKEANPTYPVPVIFTRKELERIIRSISTIS